MKDEHILLSTDGPDANVLKLKPPMVFTMDNVDEVISTLDRILKECRDYYGVQQEKTTTKQKSTDLPSKEPRTIKTPIKEREIKSI